MKKIYSLLFILMIFSGAALADVRLPNPKMTPSATPTPVPQDIEIPFTIRVNPNFDKPTLRISRNAAKALRAQLDAIDGKGTTETTQAAAFSISKMPTLMSGLFLSLAIIFGGVWVIRGRKPGKFPKIPAGVLIFALLGVSVYTAFANVAPPPFIGLNGSLFSDAMQNHWNGATSNVTVEFTDWNDSEMQLIIPRDGKDVTKRKGD